MSKIIYRVTAFVLAAVMLAGCISCDVTERHENVTQSYDKNQRFELVVTPVAYSEEFIERSAVSFADIGERAVLLIKNVKITPKQKTDLKNYFKTDVFPIIVMAQIYSHEIDILFDAAMDYLLNTEEKTSFEIFAELYKTATEATDSKRVGIVAFEMSKNMISEKAEQSRARYEKYGYQWYLDDAVKYEKLCSELSAKLGKSKFIKASNIAFFVLASVYGIGMPENELGLSVNEKETVAILGMQADYFIEAGISVEDWKIFAGVLTELVPENKTTHLNAELYALKQEDYFVSAAEVMPPLLEFYKALTAKLYEGGENLYLDGKAVNLKAIIRAALASEAELRALLDKLQTHAATSAKSEADAVKSLKLTDAYADFTEAHEVIGADGLIEALDSAVKTDSAVGSEELARLFASYFVGIAPYLTFAVCAQS